MGMIRMATDVGGTFTDIVWVDEHTGQVKADKSPTTPRDVVEGVLEATRKTTVPAARIGQFVHGSTVATNALIVMGGGVCGLMHSSMGRCGRSSALPHSSQLAGREM